MLWFVLVMLSIGSLAAFSVSVSRALGGSGGGGAQAVRAERDVPFVPGLRLAPPARPGGVAPAGPGGAPVPRGSLLDLSV